MGSVYGYELESELPLRRVRDLPGPRGSLRLERGAEDSLDRPGELIAAHDWGPGGNRFELVSRERTLLLSWTVSGAFEIDPAAGWIGVLTPEFSEHRLASTVIPLLLAERGDLVFHASAVAVGGRAVLFCAPSGRGKSTLALQAHRLGHGVLSDDGAVVEVGRGGTAWPGLHGVVVEEAGGAGTRTGAVEARSPMSRRRRLRMLAADPDCGPAPVAAICELTERGDDLSVARLSPVEAVPALDHCLIHAGGSGSLRRAFSLLARLVERTPVFRVAMPDAMSRAGAATAGLLEAVLAADSVPTAPL